MLLEDYFEVSMIEYRRRIQYAGTHRHLLSACQDIRLCVFCTSYAFININIILVSLKYQASMEMTCSSPSVQCVENYSEIVY